MTQLEKLFDEILEHVRWTGDAVFVADEPASMPPKIGWSSGSKHWSVSLGQAARDLPAVTNAPNEPTLFDRRCRPRPEG